MPVFVSCPNCGTASPSRMRARSESHFTEVNLFLGPVVEKCRICGFFGNAQPGDRAWHPEQHGGRVHSRHHH